MRITERLRSRTPFFSFEFFPPRTDEGVESLLATVGALKELDPAYVSVTYGAGGSTRGRTLDVAKRIKTELSIEVLAHITCGGSTVDSLRATFDELQSAGIQNILALRGDPPRGSVTFEPVAGGLSYANELVGMLEREYDFCIGAACYPEKHPEAASFHADLESLERKVNAGARFLVTQLFFENAHYFEFVARARARGITVPIVPGIMPITNYDQVARFTAMCGASIPASLVAELDRRKDDPDAVEDLGVAYATLQCVELLDRGAPGVHFYTLNKSPATRAVVSALYAAKRV